MADLEKILKGWERCDKCNFPALLGDQTPYMECEYTIGLYCGQDKLIRQTRELIREQEIIINNQSKCISELNKRIETLEKVNSINLNPKWPYVFNNYRKVVLCKDCRWWHESKLEQFKGFGECGQANGIALKPHDWFCADGECKDT